MLLAGSVRQGSVVLFWSAGASYVLRKHPATAEVSIAVGAGMDSQAPCRVACLVLLRSTARGLWLQYGTCSSRQLPVCIHICDAIKPCAHSMLGVPRCEFPEAFAFVVLLLALPPGGRCHPSIGVSSGSC